MGGVDLMGGMDLVGGADLMAEWIWWVEGKFEVWSSLEDTVFLLIRQHCKGENGEAAGYAVG